MHIVLCCNAGMSTGLLVEHMKKAAAARGLSLSIEAIPSTMIEGHLTDCKAVLLGPQIRYQESALRKKLAPLGIPLTSIPPTIYGRADGDAALDLALELTKQS